MVFFILYTSRYLDDIFTIDNPEFDKHIPDKYPAELKLNKAKTSDKEISFLDLYIKVIGSDIHTSVYDKRDLFGFSIVNFPWLSGDVPRLPSYGIYISQLVRFARCCTRVLDFHSKNLQITSKLLIPPYFIHGEELKVTEKTKYLGVTITSNLSWNHHIENVCKKTKNTTAFLRRNLSSCPAFIMTSSSSNMQRQYGTHMLYKQHIHQFEARLNKSFSFLIPTRKYLPESETNRARNFLFKFGDTIKEKCFF